MTAAGLEESQGERAGMAELFVETGLVPDSARCIEAQNVNLQSGLSLGQHSQV